MYLHTVHACISLHTSFLERTPPLLIECSACFLWYTIYYFNHLQRGNINGIKKFTLQSTMINSCIIRDNGFYSKKDTIISVHEYNHSEENSI